MNIPYNAVQAAHAAICEQNFDDCLEWRGKCVKAVEAAAPHLMAKAWDESVSEGEACGWVHEHAGNDMRKRNPHRSQA